MTAVDQELKDYFEDTKEKKKVELRKTKIIVDEVLEESNEARNSDKVLIDDYCFKVTGERIPEEILNLVASFESITRCRRKTQAEGLFMSDKQIADKRKANAEEVKEWARE